MFLGFFDFLDLLLLEFLIAFMLFKCLSLVML